MLIATLVAASVVAWQSWETRRSANAAKEASTIANTALAIARAEEGHSRRLVAESLRARIDAKTPTVTILPASPTVQGDWDRLAVRFPADAGDPLTVVARVTLRNESEESVTLRCQIMDGRTGVTDPEDESVQLPPGATGHYDFRTTRPLATWAAIADWQYQGPTDDEDGERFRETNKAERDVRVNFTYLSPHDVGAWDIYGFLLRGSPLTRSVESDSEYKVHHRGDLRFDALPVDRRYYISRSAGIELPPVIAQISLDPPNIDHEKAK